MKIKFSRLSLLSALVYFSFSVTSVYADNKYNDKQIISEQSNYLQNAIKGNKKIICTIKAICKSNLLSKFYSQNNYMPIWLFKDRLNSRAQELLLILKKSYLDGLDPNDYYIYQLEEMLSHLNNSTSSDDTLSAEQIALMGKIELTLTDAFFLYANDLTNGLINIKKDFPDWKPAKQQPNFIELLNSVVKTSNPKEELRKLDPVYPGYALLKEQLAQYQKILVKKGEWPLLPQLTKKNSSLKLGSTGNIVSLLQQRLLFSGELSKINEDGVFDSDLETAVLTYQANNGLYQDGVVHKDTIQSLNISLTNRIAQIALNMNRMRLLPNNIDKLEYIMVNIPNYSMELVKDNVNQLEMDTVVGSTKNQSCILNSKMDYLVINPYWNVPVNIATKEILPKMKKNPNFLASRKMQMLARGNNGNYAVVNEKDYNWSSVNIEEFQRYRFRQVPGPGNSLGKVKFMFPNSCQIYLHDTNEPYLFEAYKRDFSHGCIRLENPLALTKYLLEQDTTRDFSSSKVRNLFATKEDYAITLTKPINVYLMYFTAWVDPDNNTLQFRQDIYNKDKLGRYSVVAKLD